MYREIPVGGIVELKNSPDDWRVISYLDNEVPRFCRQYSIMNLSTGETKRAFKHELFEKNTATYLELNDFFNQQLSQEITQDFLNSDLVEEENIQPDTFHIPAPSHPKPRQEPDKEPPSKRFKTVTDEDVDNLASKTTEPTTNAMTKWAIKLFKDWIKENEPDRSVDYLDKLTAQRLDELLSKFYASLLTRKGKEYSKSALTGLRAGINRFFMAPPYNKQFNIMQDREFQKSNNVLCGIIKELKRAGKDTAENKEPVSSADLNKLQMSGLFSIETPQTLQNKVLFDIMTHFGRRGREGLRSLKPSSFKVATDGDGHRYVAMSYNESDKTHHGVDSKEKPKAPSLNV